MRTYVLTLVILYQLSSLGCVTAETEEVEQDCPKPTTKKKETGKPFMPESFRNKYKKPWHPAWMDYCAPYHCNDYHKAACGVNRKKMRFKWFQSACHIRLNNICAVGFGNLKYDWTESKFCSQYVMYWRSGCHMPCETDGKVVCGVSLLDYRLALFKDKCALERANCNNRNTFQQYEEIEIGICANYLNLGRGESKKK